MARPRGARQAPVGTVSMTKAPVTAPTIPEVCLVVTTTLLAICEDQNAPPAARAQAARTLGEVMGMIGRNAVPPEADKPLSGMSGADLRAELARVSGLCP